MRAVKICAVHWFRALWWGFRQISGDAAYEIYLRRHSPSEGSSPPGLTPQEFYLDSIRRRYSRVSRCC